MNKSNIIVFRKGGYLGARERWIYDGVVMPAVNVYKYLGLYFTTRLSFVSACRDLASRAKNTLVCVLQKLYLLNTLMPKCNQSHSMGLSHGVLIKLGYRFKKFICTR